ncbi:MAG: hypothetical protein ACE5LS_00695 [Thermoplasmata archaeon]
MTALLVATLFGGMVTQEAKAQTYQVEVDFALQRSFLLGQDIIVIGRISVLTPQAVDDTINVTVFSPDPNIPANSQDIFVPAMTSPGDPPFTFAIQQVTFAGGNFGVTVTSGLEGILLPTTSYPVPNHDVDVRISGLTGELGTQFLVTTTIHVGNMSEIQSRFDVEYVLDGVPLRQSTLVTLFGEVIALISDGTISLLSFTQPEAGRSWETTQSFTLAPGNHTLAVSVVDWSVAETVFATTFTLQVFDQIEGLETRVDELALELGGQVDELNGRTNSAEQAAVAAGTLAGSIVALSLIAIGLSVITLLIQFGILKIGRSRRGGGKE